MNDGMDFIRMNGWMVFMCFNQELLYVTIVMTGNIIIKKKSISLLPYLVTYSVFHKQGVKMNESINYHLQIYL